MSDSNVSMEKSRSTWGSRMGFILAAAGISIGVGNIWRFPYLVGQNGGGAFIVAYLAILAFVGIPIMIMEFGVGKYTGKGMIETYITGTGNKVVGTILGAYIAIIPVVINMTYIVIIGYAAYYVYASVIGLWTQVPPEIIYTNLVADKTTLLSLFIGLTLFNSYIVYRGINKGLEFACKIMIPMVFVGLFALLARALFIPQILTGLDFYMRPDWSYLSRSSVWLAAGSQAAFSLGIGPGMLIVYGSHLRKKSDVTLNAVTVSFLDTAVAILAGFAIIPAVVALGMNPESGAPLIFIALPTLFGMIPGGQFLAILFFIAVFFAGLSSSISHLETPVTSYMDYFQWSREKAVAVFTLVTILGGAIAVFNMQFLDIISVWIGDYCYSLSALLAVLVFGWKLGADKIRGEINTYSNFKVGPAYDFILKFVATPALAIIVVSSFL